jgi:hybrid cluster-associated redox disulfide protein
MRDAQLDDPDLALVDLMTLWPKTIPVFVRHRMLCVGCVIGPFHTVADACAEYHLDEAVFLAELLEAAEMA